MATALPPFMPTPKPPRRSPSLRLLLPATYLALVVLSVGGLILWAGLQLQATRFTQVSNDLELQARLIANGIEEPLVLWQESEYETDDDEDHRPLPAIPSDSALIRQVTSAAENITGRITLTDASLRVLYSSNAAVPTGTTLNTPEFTTQTRDVRRDAWSAEQRLFVAAPLVKPGGTLAGYVQLSLPTSNIAWQNAQTWIGLLVAGGSVALLTALISLVLAHFILPPIEALTRGATVIAAGDLTQQVRPGGPEELRRLATAFNLMTARLRDLLARQRDFVAHAAHELRTPLTALSLRLEMVQTHGQNDPELAARYLTQMADEIEYLRRLSAQLLDLAALDAHELPPRAPLDLAPLLYRLADDFGPLAQRAGHSLRVEVPAHLPAVNVNADQIQAAIRNLLDNAIKYTTPEGTITLSAATSSNALHITVTDTGTGIPEEAQSRIFDRFYRIDKARGRSQGGTGLGLALVKAIAEAHGGSIKVHSRPNEGSRFIFTLPRTQSHI